MIDSYIKYKDLYFEKYLKNQDIVRRIKQITSEIDEFYKNEEILFVGVLNGVVPFMNHVLLMILQTNIHTNFCRFLHNQEQLLEKLIFN